MDNVHSTNPIFLKSIKKTYGFYSKKRYLICIGESDFLPSTDFMPSIWSVGMYNKLPINCKWHLKHETGAWMFTITILSICNLVLISPLELDKMNQETLGAIVGPFLLSPLE